MKWLRRFWPYIVLALLVAGNATVWVERQQIADWWKLRNYQTPADIIALANDTTMTDYGRHLFYVNHPVLESKKAFNDHCADKSEETAVLGCYHGNRRGIYLYAVTDSRLDGVRQVTAAHEMLHQAYDRLSTKERKRVDKLLEDFYASDLTEQDVKTKIESYKKQGANTVNEMHSIFGSEVRNLPPALETYYEQYFSDRLKIVGYSESYQAEFTRRKDLVEQYDAQLTDIKTKISNSKGDLSTKLKELKSREKEINEDVTGQNQAEYNGDVQAYNAMVEAYNSELIQTRNLIAQYNKIVNERNDIAVQEQQLQEALDSRLTNPSQKQE
jgi:ribosome recycling factor